MKATPITIKKHTKVRRRPSPWYIQPSGTMQFGLAMGAGRNNPSNRIVHTGTTKVRTIEQAMRTKGYSPAYECNPDETQYSIEEIRNGTMINSELAKWAKLEKQFDKKNRSIWYRIINKRRR